MKKIVLFLSIFSFCIVTAQPYLPIVDQGHAWSIDFGDGFTGSIVTRQYTMGEMAVFNGKTYSRLYRDTIATDCYLREENGQLFVYENGVEGVLIDLNLEVGDVFNFWTNPNNCLNWRSDIFEDLEVVGVYTDFIAGEDRKVIELVDYPNTGIPPYTHTEFWIEGIGSTSGIGPGGFFFDQRIELVCFSDDGVITFFNGATSCDNTTLSVPDAMKDQIVLSPNPIQDISILQLPSELNIDHVRIYDISGKLISEEIITKDYTTINAMNFAVGLYFYQALSENIVIRTDRFIIK